MFFITKLSLLKLETSNAEGCICVWIRSRDMVFRWLWLKHLLLVVLNRIVGVAGMAKHHWWLRRWGWWLLLRSHLEVNDQLGLQLLVPLH